MIIRVHGILIIIFFLLFLHKLKHSIMANDRKIENPKFPGADVSGKKLVNVNPRTRVYVDKNITEAELEKIKAKYNNVINNVTGHEFGKERKGLN